MRRTSGIATNHRQARTPLSQKRADRFWALLFIAPQLIGLLAFSVFPLGFGLRLSFMEWDGFGTREYIGLENYREQLQSTEFRKAFWNTLYYTVLTVPFGLFLALIVAIGVDKIRGRQFYRAFYFAPVVTSSVAVAVVWQFVLNGEFGILNAVLREWFGLHPPNWLADTRFVMPAISLMSVWWTLGLNVIIFLAGLQSIPPVLHEAARVDGATAFQIFRQVTLPLLSPTIFFSVVIAVISSFQTFDQVFVMTDGGPLDSSRTMVYHVYDLAFRDFAFGASSAAAMMLFVLILAVTLVQFVGQRRWVHYES